MMASKKKNPPSFLSHKYYVKSPKDIVSINLPYRCVCFGKEMLVVFLILKPEIPQLLSTPFSNPYKDKAFKGKQVKKIKK